MKSVNTNTSSPFECGKLNPSIKPIKMKNKLAVIPNRIFGLKNILDLNRLKQKLPFF